MPVTVLLKARAKFVFSSTESLFRMFFKINAITFLLRFRAVFKWMSKTTSPFRLLFLVIGSKISPRFFKPMRSKTKTWQLERAIFPALWESCRQLQGILISLSRCLLLLWLVDGITLAYAFRQSLENALSHQYFQLILVFAPIVMIIDNYKFMSKRFYFMCGFVATAYCRSLCIYHEISLVFLTGYPLNSM